jgi:DNA polymerase-1
MWNAAENIYRVPYNQVTKKMYDEAKNGVYGANYGIGASKVSRMYNIDFQQAKFIIERYHQAVPEIQDVYQKEIREDIDTKRVITNPFGRERVFLGRPDEELYRAAYSHYCQSTVADIINLALSELESGPEWMETLLQVHDELVIQVPEDKVIEGCRLVKRALEKPMVFSRIDEPLIIPAEIATGRNWFDVEKIECQV